MTNRKHLRARRSKSFLQTKFAAQFLDAAGLSLPAELAVHLGRTPQHRERFAARVCSRQNLAEDQSDHRYAVCPAEMNHNVIGLDNARGRFADLLFREIELSQIPQRGSDALSRSRRAAATASARLSRPSSRS